MYNCINYIKTMYKNYTKSINFISLMSDSFLFLTKNN